MRYTIYDIRLLSFVKKNTTIFKKKKDFLDKCRT